MIYKSFSRQQLLAMTWWNRENLAHFDSVICDGAVRSGKTVATVVGFFLWSMARFDRQVFAICGKTVGALRRNMIIHLPDWLGGLFTITESRSENKLTLSCGDKKNVYYLFGGQDEASAGLIQGITLAGVLLDEVALMPRSFVEQACARCSVAGSKMWFSCNPASPEHWFYKQWICMADEKNALHLHFTMNDNPALDASVRARYERLYTGVFYRRFILGQWCAAQGLIYEFDENKHIFTTPPPSGRYFISVDYGTQNPFSAGLWCVCGGKAYRLREFYYCGRENGHTMTDEEYVLALKNLAGNLPIEQVVIDPSAASLIAALRGVFPVRRARNDVLSGIRLVASLLQAGVLQFSDACRDTIREFALYRWADGEDCPVKENDHAMDDIRYFCNTILRRLR